MDAVEIAIKVLEDREITNAGYGSNLAMDGVVECDATIVDQHGRSGAVGAVSRMLLHGRAQMTLTSLDIRNPICLARIILLRSLEPLSLRRVPPNLLVGAGATDFAVVNGMSILPHDALISPAARERWCKWKDDLHDAEATTGNFDIEKDLSTEYEAHQRSLRQEHASAVDNRGFLPRNLAVKPWNMVRLPSEAPSLALSTADTPRSPGTPAKDLESFTGVIPPASSLTDSADPYARYTYLTANPSIQARDQSVESPHSRKADPTADHDNTFTDPLDEASHDLGLYHTMGQKAYVESAREPASDIASAGSTPVPSSSSGSSFHAASNEGSYSTMPSSSGFSQTLPSGSRENSSQPEPEQAPFREEKHRYPQELAGREDSIIDTVGAIAIDSMGRIAAGSSSGGIGMKHRGRVGPAALVGIGTAVFPEDPDDRERISVAAVTSGTGEHMATTMAASTVADRLYHSIRKLGPGKMEYVHEDQVMRSVIENEFMGTFLIPQYSGRLIIRYSTDHPSVKRSTSQAAIGILAVKKTVAGIHVYFAHNTDSFVSISLPTITAFDLILKCDCYSSRPWHRCTPVTKLRLAPCPATKATAPWPKAAAISRLSDITEDASDTCPPFIDAIPLR